MPTTVEVHHINEYQYTHLILKGDPKEIPNLTHEQLVKFHATHYHPSNARFITYGTFCSSHLAAAV